MALSEHATEAMYNLYTRDHQQRAPRRVEAGMARRSCRDRRRGETVKRQIKRFVNACTELRDSASEAGDALRELARTIDVDVDG